jgi:tetratricopeptide (TPR) repeat protein
MRARAAVAAWLTVAVAGPAAGAPLWEDVAQPNRRRCTQLLEEAAQARAHDQTPAAAAVLRKAAALCPAERDVLQALGEALLTLRQFPEARAALERARLSVRELSAAREADVALAFHVGFAREVTGDLEGAIEAHRALEALGGLPPPNQYLVHYDLGDELMAVGRLGEAIDEYRRAVALAADRPVPRLALAVALDRDGQSDKSRAELAIVLSLDPQLHRMNGEEYVFVPAADAHFYRALSAAARGATAEARASLRAFLVELPDGPYAQHARRRLSELELRVDPREVELLGDGVTAAWVAQTLSPAIRSLEECVPDRRLLRVAFDRTSAGLRAQSGHPAAACFDRVLGSLATAGRGGPPGPAFAVPLAGRRAAASPP